MIVAKAPLRCSFFGGGSDIPEFYNQHSGMVISTSINKHINIAINRCETNHIRVIYSDLEVAKNVNQIKHDRVREILKVFNIDSNFELCSFSDVSTKGTGLGSSSTFTVGLSAAVARLCKLNLDRKSLAEFACMIEIEKCKQPIGKQDQYAAVYGGLNVIRFNKDQVEVTPFSQYGSALTIYELEQRLLCFGTKITRSTSDILEKQVDNIKNGDIISQTQEMVSVAENALVQLKNNRIDSFGALLDYTWMLKRKLAPGISNKQIDEMYDLGIKAGALGGKLLGAGGGGYMLFYVPENNRLNVIDKMTKANYPFFDFKFDSLGTRTIEI